MYSLTRATTSGCWREKLYRTDNLTARTSGRLGVAYIKLAALSVVLTAEVADAGRCFIQLKGGQPFTKDPHLGVVDDTGVAAVVAAHDVVID